MLARAESNWKHCLGLLVLFFHLWYFPECCKCSQMGIFCLLSGGRGGGATRTFSIGLWGFWWCLCWEALFRSRKLCEVKTRKGRHLHRKNQQLAMWAPEVQVLGLSYLRTIWGLKSLFGFPPPPPPPLLISLEEESKTVHKHWLRPNIEYEIFNKCLTPLGYHFQSTTIYKELTHGICKNNSVKTTFKDIGLHEDNLPILLHNNLAVQRSQNTHRCAHHLCSARLQIALWGWHCSLLCLSALLAQ